ncbi:MAG: hypothetical protein KGL02_00830 [Acidobacteriota bacterium]|nr:hypothetical protein [Acidobacteriota bacterium]MDE3171159.1 hypothetical protein [Acidobacteriota bacterium]
MDLHDDQNCYVVEVSGWDVAEGFFVERTELTWSAEGIKEIRLQRPVREGSMLFVRLMQPATQNENYPIACEAVKVTKEAARDGAIIQLTQSRPRALIRRALRELKFPSIRVA